MKKKHTINTLLEEHFIDDRNNHTDIKMQVEKYQARVDGISESLNRITRTVEDIKHMAQERDVKLNAHMKRMEPMIAEYEREVSTTKEIKHWGENVMFVSKILSAVAVVGGILTYIVKKFST
jgi:archaellum component FlaC